MRPQPKDTGWCGSLFDEPITLVAAPWASKAVDTFAGAAFRQPVPKIESSQDEGLDFSKEWYYCASGNAIRNHLPCDECIRSEPREEIHCIRFFKLHPCAYFNSAHCNGSTCEYWSPYGDNPHCTYGPYLAWLAVPPAPAIEPTKKPVKAKKPKLEPAPAPFTKNDQEMQFLRSDIVAIDRLLSELPADHVIERLGFESRKQEHEERLAILAPAVKPVKEPIAVLLDGKWYSAGKMLWDCSDCLCLACANEGKSCHDCKGFERCKKIGGTGGKIGACPDFRTEEGKEQHCLENGCLCFKCQLIGTDCEQCVGPIRCDKPRMKCKEYVGAEVEA